MLAVFLEHVGRGIVIPTWHWDAVDWCESVGRAARRASTPAQLDLVSQRRT